MLRTPRSASPKSPSRLLRDGSTRHRIAFSTQRSGFRELALSGRHAARLATMPAHHRDPFDRLLVAQALEEPARLLTADRRLAVYSELVMVV